MTFAAAQWGMLIVLAKLGSPELVGVFVLGLAVTGPPMLLANLKLRDILATDARHEFTFAQYLAVRLVTTALVFLVIAAIGWMSGFDLRTSVVILLVAIAKSFDGISDILYGYLQLHERMDRIAISRILQGFAQLLALAVVLLATGSLALATLAWAIASALITFVWDVPNTWRVHSLLHAGGGGQQTGWVSLHNDIVREWHLRGIWRLAWLTLPMGLAVMLGSLWLNIPRYFIAAYLGNSELGIFAAISSLMVAGSLIVGALAQAAGPRLAQHIATGQYATFDRLVIQLVAAGAGIGISGLAVITLFGYQILMLLYGPVYAEHVDILFWLMVAVGAQLSYTFLGAGIQAMRNFRIHLPVQIMSTIVVLTLCYFLLGRYGLMGAVLAMLVANGTELLGYTIGFLVVRKQVRQQPFANRLV